MADKDLNLTFTVSMTTRQPKANEVEGKDYFFVSHRDFAEAVKNREFLEYTEFNGYYYGTPKKQVEDLIASGKNVLIEVEAQGVGGLKLNLPQAIAFFVMPESFEELEKQIQELYHDDQASVERRLSKAKMEMELAPLFNHVVSNNDPDASEKQIKEVLLKEMEKNR